MKSIRLLMRKLQGEINMDSKRVIKRLALGLAVLATVTTSKSVEAFEVNQNVVSIEAQSITTQVPSDSYQDVRSEEHTSELQSRQYLVCRLLLEKKKNSNICYADFLSNNNIN